MFRFLKRAVGAVKDYAAGKAFWKWYQIAELTTMVYVQKVRGAKDNPAARNLAICMWSYMLFTEPRSEELAAFKIQHQDEIEREALQLLETDEPFREVIVSTMWVGLGVCRGQDDKTGFDRILNSKIFDRYSSAYPMPSPDKYAALVEGWANVYSPPPAAASVGK